MAKCKIEGGICAFITSVEAHQVGKRNIRLKITSDCPNVSKLAEEFVEVDPLDEIAKRANSAKTYEMASKHCPHPSCIVPSGILKTIEVAAGFALPKDAVIKIEK